MAALKLDRLQKHPALNVSQTRRLSRKRLQIRRWWRSPPFHRQEMRLDATKSLRVWPRLSQKRRLVPALVTSALLPLKNSCLTRYAPVFC